MFRVLLKPTFVANLKALRTMYEYKVMADPINQDALLANSKRLPPSLDDATRHKGQAGRVAVVGGSLEYTGAPYLAAITALRVGADLVHVFCAPDAAVPIKCYSPELIVHPLLAPDRFDDVRTWLERMDVVLIGPGLGRDDVVLGLIEKLVGYAKELRKPLIVDADALYLVTRKPELLRGFDSDVVLTPNRAELSRLLLGGLDAATVIRDSGWGPRVTILAKGAEDEAINLNGRIAFKGLGGSNRRCGGQGDVLGGCLAVFLNWSKTLTEHGVFTACFAACKMVRECNSEAFAEKGRSMIASDMIEKVHSVFRNNFEQ